MREEAAASSLHRAVLTRREVVASGGVSLVAFGWASAAHSAAAPAGLVLDTRFGHVLAPGASSGWTHRIDGDVTRLWVDRLDLAWRSPGTAIAGATGDDALFVLERLAWDRSRRVVLRQPVPGVPGPTPLVRWLIADRVRP